MKGQETVMDLVDHTAQRSQHHDTAEQKENPRSGKYQHQTLSLPGTWKGIIQLSIALGMTQLKVRPQSKLP